MDSYKTLVNQGKEAYLKQLNAIGWFDQAQQEQAAIENHIAQIEEVEHLMYALSYISFDAEGFDEAADYESIISEVLQYPASQHLKVRFEQEGLLVKINIAGKNQYTFEVDLDVSFGWFDDDLIEFLNDQVFAGEGLQERLFAIPACDQSIDLTFISETLYNQALKAGVLTDDLEFFM